MGVVQVRIQTVEDIYRLIWNAVSRRCPITATYRGRRRRPCRYRLGRNAAGELRVLCYQYAGESSSGLEPVGSPANWRCMKVERLSLVELWNRSVADRPEPFPPATCVVKADIDAEDYPERDPQNGQ